MTMIRNFTDGDGNTTEGAEARVHEFPNHKAKMMFELDYDFGVRLTEAAVRSGGRQRVRITLVDDGGNAEPVDARINSFSPETGDQISTVGQPGVCNLSQINWRT